MNQFSKLPERPPTGSIGAQLFLTDAAERDQTLEMEERVYSARSILLSDWFGEDNKLYERMFAKEKETAQEEQVRSIKRTLDKARHLVLIVNRAHKPEESSKQLYKQ